MPAHPHPEDSRLPLAALRPGWRAVALVLGLLLGLVPASGSPLRQDLSPDPKVVDLGVQPMAYPLAFISSTMLRDRLLRADLRRLGLELRPHPYRKGNDMVDSFGGGRLDLAFLGDMPTVNVLVRAPAAVVGLGKRNFSSIVSRDMGHLEELRGKVVGYSPGSSSHLVLLRGLQATGMSERDVTLLELEPSAMPDALDSGKVQAFSAWEPTPTIAMSRNPRNRSIYRGMSTDWVVISRDFATQRPEAAQALVASFARAVAWMRASGSNLSRAAAWVLADGRAFTGQPPPVTAARAMEIARHDLLDIPGAPAVPAKLDGMPPLVREFEFLQRLGRLPKGADVKRIGEAFTYPALRQVQADPKRFRLHTYDYDP